MRALVLVWILYTANTRAVRELWGQEIRDFFRVAWRYAAGIWTREDLLQRTQQHLLAGPARLWHVWPRAGSVTGWQTTTKIAVSYFSISIGWLTRTFEVLVGCISGWIRPFSFWRLHVCNHPHAQEAKLVTSGLYTDEKIMIPDFLLAVEKRTLNNQQKWLQQMNG